MAKIFPNFFKKNYKLNLSKPKKGISERLSSSTGKELGSHFVLTISKKLKRLKINNSSQIFKRGKDTGKTTAPRLERKMQIQGVMAPKQTETGTQDLKLPKK